MDRGVFVIAGIGKSTLLYCNIIMLIHIDMMYATAHINDERNFRGGCHLDIV